jgi:hypothetical protein
MNVLGLIDGCIAFGGRGDTINFLPIESPDKCEQRQWPNVHGSVHTSVGESSWLSSVFVEGLGVDSAGVINPITGEVLFTTPSGTPRCAGAGYWVVGPELHFARKSSGRKPKPASRHWSSIIA